MSQAPISEFFPFNAYQRGEIAAMQKTLLSRHQFLHGSLQVTAFLVFLSISALQLQATSPLGDLMVFSPVQGEKIARPSNADSDDEIEIPKYEHIILDTPDGVRLKCTYFAPPKVKDAAEDAPKKPAMPFILLHDWEGDRRQLLKYGLFLQKSGHAVIVPDLRGHGQSVSVEGLKKPLDYKKFRKQEVMSAQKDIERCKKFLVQKHNQGDVNIDLLSVVAVGETSVLAVQWILNDWFAFPSHNPQGIKQGQDVKSLMLVSPVKKLAGVSMVNNIQHPLFTSVDGSGAMPMLVLWSSFEKTAKESKEIAEILGKHRPDVSKIEDKAERLKASELIEITTKKNRLSGVEMLANSKVDNLWKAITVRLFENKVAANAEQFPWITREVDSGEDE